MQKVRYGKEAREALLKGVNGLADVVESTLGPSGHSVILDLDPGNPVATKDGVTIAKAVKLDNPLENAGAQMLKQASVKTAEEAGDGTTTATVLARELYREASKAERSFSGYNSVQVQQGMEYAAKKITEYIQHDEVRPVADIKQLRQIAAISANSDEQIGELVASALDSVGSEGAVTIEESKTGETYLDTVEGIQFKNGYKSPYFVTDNDTMTAVLDDALIMLVDKKLTNIKELVPALDGVAASTKSLLIVAEDISGEVLSTLILNKVRAGFRVCAVKAPEFGDKRKAALEDIAILTGGTVVSPDKGMRLDKFDPEWFGSAKKVTVSRDDTTIIGADGDSAKIDARVEEIKAQIDNAKSLYDKEQLQTRLARFAGGVAVMYVGGHTELEMKERKDRVDDALHAAKAAIAEGICIGGGRTLYVASDKAFENEDDPTTSFGFGVSLVRKACKVPFVAILKNAGWDNDEIEAAVELLDGEKDGVVDVDTKKVIKDAFKAGIVDPVKVVRLALKNAVSVAGTMITSEALVVNIPEKEDSGTPDLF